MGSRNVLGTSPICPWLFLALYQNKTYTCTWTITCIVHHKEKNWENRENKEVLQIIMERKFANASVAYNIYIYHSSTLNSWWRYGIYRWNKITNIMHTKVQCSNYSAPEYYGTRIWSSQRCDESRWLFCVILRQWQMCLIHRGCSGICSFFSPQAIEQQKFPLWKTRISQLVARTQNNCHTKKSNYYLNQGW